jgi:hypothetical protein
MFIEVIVITAFKVPGKQAPKRCTKAEPCQRSLKHTNTFVKRLTVLRNGIP